MPARFTGFDKLIEETKDAERILKSLNGISIGEVDSTDPASVRRALSNFNRAVAQRVGRHRNNPFIKKAVAEIKRKVEDDLRAGR